MCMFVCVCVCPTLLFFCLRLSKDFTYPKFSVKEVEVKDQNKRVIEN